MMRKRISLLLMGTLVIGLLAGCNQAATPSSTSKIKSSTQVVKRGNLQLGLSADGRVSLSQTSLNFEVSGIVKKVNVKEGQTVKAGAVLAELDPTDLNLAIENAQNALNRANANYEDAVNQRSINIASEKIKLQQMKAEKEAKPNDSIVAANYNLEVKRYNNLVNSDSSISNAKLSVKEAKTNLAQAKNDLSKIYLKAPYNGRILSINYQVGELVTGTKGSSGNGNNANSSSNAFMTICDPKLIYVNANATESDVPGIEPGQEMRVTIDALSLENMPGEVVSVSNVPQIDGSGIVTYKVVGKLTEPNDTIKDGMTAFMTYLKKEKQGVLLIPNKAIAFENGQQYVNVKGKDGKITKTPVTCGLTNGTQSEVVQGLDEGDTVVIGGVSK